MDLDPYLGEMRPFAGNYAPEGWHFCDGALLPITGNSALFELIGTTYGGDGVTTFALPDLRGRAAMGMGILPTPSPVTYNLGDNSISAGTPTTLAFDQLAYHAHNPENFNPGTVTQPVLTASIQASPTPGTTSTPSSSVAIARTPKGTAADMYVPGQVEPSIAVGGFSATVTGDAMGTGTLTLSSTGGSTPVDLRSPFFVMNYIIALQGIPPGGLSNQFMGEVRIMSYKTTPNGWAECDGSILPIAGNSILFALLKNRYGGDGQTTFALPNLQGRIPLSCTKDSTSPVFGARGGSPSVVLQPENLPTHSHKATLTFNPSQNAALNVTLSVSNSPGSSDLPVNGSFLAGAPNGLPFDGILSSNTTVADMAIEGTSASLPPFTPSVAIGSSGSFTPVDIRPAYLVINYVIANMGIFPTPPEDTLEPEDTIAAE